MKKRIQISLAIATALALTLTGCSSSDDAAENTFTIAYQGPLSGGEASTGTDEQNAVTMKKLFGYGKCNDS